MKPKDIYTNGTNCCKEQERPNHTDCCSAQEAQNHTDCCSAQERQSHTDCCKEQEAQNHTDCCGAQERQNHTDCCGAQERQNHTDCCGAFHSEGDSHHQPPKGSCQEVFESSNDEVSALVQHQALLAVANDKYVRLCSEFDNFKKRVAKERMALIHKANEKILRELLPVVDDFERGITALQGAYDGMQYAMQEGIQLIYDKLRTLLKRFDVQEMVLEQGSEFNADLHEAITQKPIEDPTMKGKVIAVVEKGYLINEYVLRFAKVVIGV